MPLTKSDGAETLMHGRCSSGVVLLQRGRGRVRISGVRRIAEYAPMFQSLDGTSPTIRHQRPYTMNVRHAVALASLALALFAAPALGSALPASTSKADTPVAASATRQAMPAQRPASSPTEPADARAKRLQRLRIESCRQRPQTCVQPPADGAAASAPAINR
jgi:hypothetical protein